MIFDYFLNTIFFIVIPLFQIKTDRDLQQYIVSSNKKNPKYQTDKLQQFRIFFLTSWQDKKMFKNFSIIRIKGIVKSQQKYNLSLIEYFLLKIVKTLAREKFKCLTHLLYNKTRLVQHLKNIEKKLHMLLNYIC